MLLFGDIALLMILIAVGPRCCLLNAVAVHDCNSILALLVTTDCYWYIANLCWLSTLFMLAGTIVSSPNAAAV